MLEIALNENTSSCNKGNKDCDTCRFCLIISEYFSSGSHAVRHVTKPLETKDGAAMFSKLLKLTRILF